MIKSKDLTNQKFGKLTVINKADSVFGGKTVKRYWGAWNCKCDCGNMKTVKTIDLNRGSVISCGCLYKLNGKSLNPGQKINRLTTISYKNGKWFCLCDCGNTVEISTHSITTNNTKSCGCLKTETSSKNATNLINKIRKFDPQTASARRIWKSYCYRDKYCNITFEDFLKLSQQNCFYCGITPNTKYNYFKTLSSNSSDIAKSTGEFIYNGLDRLDNNGHHTIYNIVPCCYNCNRSKNNRSINEFLLWVNNLSTINFEPIIITKLNLPKNKSLCTSIRCVFYNHKKDTDLTIEEYYSVSQMNCYYCNSSPSNCFNRAKTDKKSSQKAKNNGNYIYNGIDRIDRTFPHNKNNIVPCCYYCNFAKGKLTISEFQEWIIRIKNFKGNNG